MSEASTIVLIFTIQNVIWMAIVLYLTGKPSAQFEAFIERAVADMIKGSASELGKLSTTISCPSFSIAEPPKIPSVRKEIPEPKGVDGPTKFTKEEPSEG